MHAAFCLLVALSSLLLLGIRSDDQRALSDVLLADHGGSNKITLAPSLSPSGRIDIYFVGGSKVWHAAHTPYGFISLLNRHFAQSLKPNFTINAVAIGFKDSNIAYIANRFESELFTGAKGTTSGHAGTPGLVVLMLGDDDAALGDDSEWTAGGRRHLQFQQHYEQMLEMIAQRHGIPVLPCTLLLNGEMKSGNAYDTRISVLNDMIALAVDKYKRRLNMKDGTREIKVYETLNLRGTLQKYLESVNHDNVGHSHVTFNGQHLNEDGNALAALAVLNRLRFVGDVSASAVNSTAAALRRQLQHRIDHSERVRQKIGVFRILQSASVGADGPGETLGD